MNLFWGTSAASAAPEVSPELLLLELKAAHDQLSVSLAELNELLGQERDMQRFATARRRFADARRARAVAVKEVLDFLHDRADALIEEKLAELTRNTRQTVQRTAEHVGSWPAMMIATNWRQYGVAQRAIRSRWVDVVDAEEALLYPLLKRYAGLT